MLSHHFIATLAVTLACALGVDARAMEKFERAEAALVITGIHTGVNSATGARPLRRNINDLKRDVPQWSLYIQALSAMQAAPASDPTSYFQIAGIHGRPYSSWNGVQHNPESPLSGYCPHGSVLFPTWHRPYLALFEQIIAGHAQRIAKTYTGANTAIYQAAADNLRIPYWDWASNSNMPTFISTNTIQIITPNGVKVSVNNPLQKFTFPNFPLDKDLFPVQDDYGMASSPITLRQPEEPNSPSRPGLANGSLRQRRLKSKTYAAFVKSTSFNDFGTTATDGPGIEGVHGNVHVAIGGDNGHMGALSYSAYDPVFFLHHTNVDRLIGMFQATHPEYRLEPMVDTEGTFTVTPGSTSDASTLLKPFSADNNGTFFTSTSVMSMKPFGYSYPELEDWRQDANALQKNVTAAINTLYGPEPGSESGGSGPSFRKRETSFREWSVALAVDKYAFGKQRFMITAFVGDVPANPAEWASSAANVGEFPIFPPPGKVDGTKTVLLAHDEFALRDCLTAAKVVMGDVAATSKFLKEKLTWRVQYFNGTVIPTAELVSLSIKVQDQITSYSADKTVLPVIGKKNFHPEVTTGKPGGK